MWTIVVSEFKAFFRKPYLVLLYIVLPLVMVFFLGNFLEDVETSDNAIGTISIGYYDPQNTMKELLEQLDNEQLFFTEYDSEEAGRQSLTERKLDCFVAFDENEMILYEGTDMICNESTKALLQGMDKSRSAAVTIISSQPGKAQTIENDIREATKNSYVENKNTITSVSMMDYYAITMTIMTAVFGALATSMSFADERSSKTINRLLVAPGSRWRVFAGKVIGTVPQAVCQISATMFISMFFFHAKIGSSWRAALMIYVVMLLVAMCSNTIGVLLGLVCGGYITAVMFGIIFLMLFFSGCFAKAMAIKPVCDYLPPMIVKEAVMNYSIFGQSGQILSVAGFCIVSSLAMVLIGGVIFAKKQEDR